MSGQAAEEQHTSFEAVFRTVAALSRPDANRWLSNNLNKLSGALWQKYRSARQMELFHIRHVRRVMVELQNGGNVQHNQEQEEHDFSKDEWYFW